MEQARGKGKEESERGELKKKGGGILGSKETGRGDRLTLCLPARPGCLAPAAVRNSHKMAARPGRPGRLWREEGRGGRGNREAEASSRGEG